MKRLKYFAASALAVLLAGCMQTAVPVTTIQPTNQGPSKYVNYTVKPGDTLGEIASQYQMSYITLARLNNIDSPYVIHVGQVLQVPNPNLVADQVAVQKTEYGGDIQPIRDQNSIPAQNLNLSQYGATTGKVYVTPQPVQPSSSAGNPGAKALATQLISETNAPPAVNKSTSSTAASNSESSDNLDTDASVAKATPGKKVSPIKYKAVDQVNWSWPVTGQLVEGFGEGSGLLAKGVQISTAANAKVFAAADGSVIYSGMGVQGYGNMIIIKSDNNFLTAYTSLSKLTVKQGAAVSRGDTLGFVGTIQNQPMLHFEVRKFGTPVNPLKYMPTN